MTEPIRLSKRLAAQLPCSRREAELYIEGGWVSVDGIVIEAPQHPVRPDQSIALHPDARAEPVDPVTILLHKPAGYDADIHTGPRPAFMLLSPDTRAANDNPGITPLHRHFTRLMAPLPLETAASGLLVLTQDGRILRKLDEDADLLEQEYVADIQGNISDAALKNLHTPVTFDGASLPPVKVSRQSDTRLRFAMKGALPGQVHWMCERAGLTPVRIQRLRIGRIALSGLPEGQWRYLHEKERF
jgi:23S rRNA pseudouridine2604 synthase